MLNLSLLEAIFHYVDNVESLLAYSKLRGFFCLFASVRRFAAFPLNDVNVFVITWSFGLFLDSTNMVKMSL